MTFLQLQKLVQQDAVAALPNGVTGVKVSLQYRGDVGPLPREQRKKVLREKFSEAKAKLAGDGATFDLDTLSISGQTVDGLIPADRFEQIVSRAMGENLRVDIRTMQQVTSA